MKLVFFLLIVQWRLNARTAENFEIMPLSRSWSIWSFAFANFCCILVGHGWWEVLFGMTHSGYSGDNKLCTFNFRYLQGWTSQTVLLTLIRSPDVIAVAKHCLSVDVCWLYFEVSRRYYTSVNWLCAWSCSVLLLFPSSGALGLVCRIPGLCDRTIMQIHGFFDSALSVGEVWLCLLKFPGQVTFFGDCFLLQMHGFFDGALSVGPRPWTRTKRTTVSLTITCSPICHSAVKNICLPLWWELVCVTLGAGAMPKKSETSRAQSSRFYVFGWKTATVVVLCVR